MNLNDVRKFLLEKLASSKFERVEFQFSIQPGITGYKLFGYTNESLEGKSLKPRPPENIEQALLNLHLEIAIDEESKWNILNISLEKDKFTLKFIWDEIWQSQVDELNELHKTNNPNYTIPIWAWQKRKGIT